jgi:hypothetical protein
LSRYKELTGRKETKPHTDNDSEWYMRGVIFTPLFLWLKFAEKGD